MLATIGIFLLSCWGRYWPEGPLDGPGDISWRNLSGLVTIALERWLAQPLQFQFDWATYFSPSVPELQGLDFFYTSYPPGALLPPFFFAKVFPSLSVPLLLRNLSLLWGLFFALAAGEICRQLTDRRLLAFAAAASVLFFSPALLFFGNVWFADVYVLLPWALSLLLELRRQKTGETFRGEPILFFFGLVGEWLFWIHLLLLFLMRWRSGALTEIQKKLGFFLPTLAVAFLYLGPIFHRGLQSILYSRIAERTGFALGYWHTLGEFFTGFWLNLLPFHTGYIWLLSFGGLLLFFLFEYRKLNPLNRRIGALALAAPLLHAFLLIGHYHEHSYPALKLALPFAVLAFGVLPALWGSRTAASFAALGAVALMGVQLWQYQRISSLIVGTGAEDELFCHFVRKAAQKGDVWFSAEFSVEPFGSGGEGYRLIPLCGRYVYRVPAPEFVERAVEKLKKQNPKFAASGGHSAVFVSTDPDSADRFALRRWPID